MQPNTQQLHADRIQAVLEYIQTNLDRGPGADELAAVAGFSVWHFYRVFREVTGKSLGEYIREKRLRKAANRLKVGTESVVEIALDSGYESHSGFTRAFTARFSEAPARYRESVQTQQKPKASVAVGMRKDTTNHRREASDSEMRLRTTAYGNYRKTGAMASNFSMRDASINLTNANSGNRVMEKPVKPRTTPPSLHRRTGLLPPS